MNWLTFWTQFLFNSGSSDDLCYETGIPFDKESEVPESPQTPMSPRTVQRGKRERTLSLSKSAKSATKTDPVLRTRQRTIYTSGRPPWYDTQGQSIESFVIGLSHNYLIYRKIIIKFTPIRNLWRKCFRKDNRCPKDHWGSGRTLGHSTQSRQLL